LIIVQTPLRLSFLGGGTDFEDFYRNYGGAVISTTIDKYVFIIVKERFDDMIYVNYSKKETVDCYKKLEHELVREAMGITGISKGIEITTLADVPANGSGLGSSSSITVGLLQALYSYHGDIKTAETLAQEACRIEVEILQKPIGRQDQYISAYGNLRFITFDKEGIKSEILEISSTEKRRLNENLLLFYTGLATKSGEVLTEQKAKISEKIEVLLAMKQLAFKARDAIAAGAFDDFGVLLHQGWEYKKSLACKISNTEIDDIYSTARKAGAIGGKIAGSGGGGFLLLYCPEGRRDEVRKALKGLRELPFNFESDGSKVIFNYRRSRN
jgi:D-glycero-alpha-D-manno-heptose-7-phosphate kinase